MYPAHTSTFAILYTGSADRHADVHTAQVRADDEDTARARFELVAGDSARILLVAELVEVSELTTV